MSISTSHFDLLSQIKLLSKRKAKLCVPVQFLFFRCRSLPPCQHFFFFSPPLQNFPIFLPTKQVSFVVVVVFLFFFFISRSNSFSVIHVNVGIKIEVERQNRLCCCCCCCFCFYLKKFGKLCDLPPKRMGASKAKFHPGLHEWVDVRTEDFLRTQISQFHGLLNFLTQSAPLLDFIVVCLHSILSILNIFQNTYFIDTILFLFWFSLISDMI